MASSIAPPDLRPRNLSPLRAVADGFFDLLYAGGWPAALGRALGVQRSVTTRRYQVQVTDAPKRHRPLKVGFASDFHAGPLTHETVIYEAIERLTELAPDVLLLGGDFVGMHARYVDRIADAIGSIPAPLGTFAVLGNHDLWTDHRYIEGRLAAAGIDVITNRNVRLPEPFSHVSVAGLDDMIAGVPDADAALDGAAEVRIALMHSPDGVLALGDRPYNLALCGHTHGGQIALPSGAPIVVPEGQLCREYSGGRYRLNGVGQPERTLIVSRGIGCTGLPIRLFARPEVILCEVM